MMSLHDGEALALGASIFGCGGGGSPSLGLRIIGSAIKEGIKLVIKGLDELSDDDWLATAYFCGPIGSKKCAKKEISPNDMIKAVKLLEEYAGVKIKGIYAVELGGLNTPVALRIAGELDLPLVDADAAGRAVPEVAHSALRIKGMELFPSVIADGLGNYLIVDRYSSIDYYEGLARYMTERSCGDVFIVDGLISARDARNVLIKGTISRSIRIGKEILKAIDVKEIAKLIKGYYVTSGIIKEVKLKVAEGFLKGEYSINTEKGVIRVMVKNENIAAWINKRTLVLPPDLIILVDEHGRALINSEVKEDKFVHLILAPAPDIWQTPNGLELLGPRHFGLREKYMPVERLIKRFIRQSHTLI